MKNCPRGTSLQIPPPSFVIGHLSSYEAVRRSFETLFDRKDVRPGCVISIQTFGSYGANFNPHCHAIISDGVWTAEGEFLDLPSVDTATVCEVFRRLLLRRLHKEERLSERFMENLLSWVHPGFSVFAGQPVSPEDSQQLERLACYITRPPLAIDSIRRGHHEDCLPHYRAEGCRPNPAPPRKRCLQSPQSVRAPRSARGGKCLPHLT